MKLWNTKQYLCIDIVNPYIKLLGITDIMSHREEKTPTVSPDQGATGETASSTKKMDVGMQTGLSEEEKDAQYQKDYAEGIFRLLEEIRGQNPELCWDIMIKALYKCFTRKNRAKRSKEEIFSELEQLEALEDEHRETSGSVPDYLKAEAKWAQEQVEFENYVTLLKEARACFGYGIECIIISYINKHKGQHYCMHCICHSDKEK